MNYSDIQQFETIAGSPFYIVSRQKFQSNFDAIGTAFSSRYAPFILAYSYKTNYIPYLCRLVNQKGGWAEVVSRMEYDLAMMIGQPPEKIIFNGPVKTQDDIQYALSNGSLVNLDSAAELDDAIEYARKYSNQAVSVGLRINIGLSDATGQSYIQNSLKVGRFGFDPAGIAEIQSKLKTVDNLKIVSLHGHTSTTDRSAWCFEVITQTLCRVAEKYFPDTIQYINVGGGFFGRMHPDMPFKNTPTYDEYAEVVCSILNQNSWVSQNKPTLIIEPGVAIVADTLSFCAKVVSVKDVRGQLFVTVDGSAFNTKPTFHSLNMPHQIITSGDENPIRTFSVVGSTCMEKDYLLKDIIAPLPSPGDYVVIDSIGAYTVVMTPPFINPAPAIIVDEDGRYKLIRHKQTLDNIFGNYII